MLEGDFSSFSFKKVYKFSFDCYNVIGDFMKNQKKKVTYQTEEQREMIHFLIVLAVVIVLVLVVYFASKLFVVDKTLFEVSYQTGSVNSERAIVGTIFNRPESEYYVMVYDESKPKAVYYSAISSKYVQKQDGALAVYHVDLNNEMNKAYYVGNEGQSNAKATKSQELKFKDLTLMKIKNGKIVKYLEDIDAITKELAVTKEKKS